MIAAQRVAGAVLLPWCRRVFVIASKVSGVAQARRDPWMRKGWGNLTQHDPRSPSERLRRLPPRPPGPFLYSVPKCG